MLTKESYSLMNNLTIKDPYIDSQPLKKLFDTLEKNEFEYDEPVIQLKNGKFPVYSFISPKLQIKIKKYKYINEIKWSVQSRYSLDCTLNVYTLTKKRINQGTLNLLIYAISFLVSLSNADRKLNIHIVLLPDKKLFHKKFTPDEVNGGLSSYNSDGGEVFVWRKEECIKVLFHELIHALSFSDIEDTNEIIHHYNQKFNLSCTKMNLNETYTEIWAKLLNCYFCTKIMLKKKPFQYFCHLLSVEKEFSSVQAWKIINYLQDEYKKKKVKKNLNHSTNVVAYHLATNEILNHLNKFLNLRFQDKNIFYLTDNMKFNTMMQGFRKLSLSETKKTTKLYKTFRMTAVELKL